MKHLILTFLLSFSFITNVWLQERAAGKLSTVFAHDRIERYKVFESEQFLLAPETEMRWVRSVQDKLGADHDRYQQYYKGLKVMGSEVIIHSMHDRAERATGYLESRLDDITTSPKVDQQMAINIASIMMADVLDKEQGIKIKGTVTPKTESIDLCIINESYPGNKQNKKGHR